MSDQETTVPTIYAEPCECPPGACAHFVDNDADCISRLRGEVVTRHCAACGPGATWHHDGACLRCKAEAEGKL